MNEVFVLKEGYSYTTESGAQKADGTISLVKGAHCTVLFDTGLPVDREFICTALGDKSLGCSDVTHVVCSHGHSDHVGNIGLFPHALLFVGFDVCRGDTYFENGLAKGESYVIDSDVEVVATPGHTATDVSLIVKNTGHGTVLVAGDLFENESDIEDPSVWRTVSERPQLQSESRLNTISRCHIDVVIPGHGAMFQLTDNHKLLLKAEMSEQSR